MNDFEVHAIGTAQRLAELERDAARYRWLSSIMEVNDFCIWLPVLFRKKATKRRNKKVDAFIDRAMEQSK